MGAPSARGYDLRGELHIYCHFSAQKLTEEHVNLSWRGVLLGLTIDVKTHIAGCACAGKNEYQV